MKKTIAEATCLAIFHCEWLTGERWLTGSKTVAFFFFCYSFWLSALLCDLQAKNKTVNKSMVLSGATFFPNKPLQRMWIFNRAYKKPKRTEQKCRYSFLPLKRIKICQSINYHYAFFFLFLLKSNKFFTIFALSKQFIYYADI